MTTTTYFLLAEVLDAHGGVDRWRKFDRVTAKVVTGGFLWRMKGVDLDDSPHTITSTFRRQWTRSEPFGDPDWQVIFTPHRVLIETRAGDLLDGQDEVRDSFSRHAWETPWSPIQLAYFTGYAMWTCYNVPFVAAEPEYGVTEIAPVVQDGRILRGLCVRFPEKIHTHCPEQSLYFGSDGLLHRHDYRLDIAGKSRVAHLLSDYVAVQGLWFPTRIRVFLRSRDGTPQYDQMIVSADLSDFELG